MNRTLTKDLLMNMNLGLSAVLIVLVIALSVAAKAAIEHIEPPGQIAVLVCWPEGSIDVDTWADAPGQDIATGYSAKSGKVWSLLRDDLGTSNDSAVANCESMFARSTPAGEFVINIHGYSLPTGPVTVHVEVALNTSLLVNTDLELRAKQERTVVRFSIDHDGRIVPGSVSSVYKPLRSAKK